MNKGLVVSSDEFNGACPLFFEWDRGVLTASCHVCFPGLETARERFHEPVIVGQEFCIGGERGKGSPKGQPHVVFTEISPPRLAIEWGYFNQPHIKTAEYEITESGTYVTLGSLGLVRIIHANHPTTWYDNSQARLIGASRQLTSRFEATLAGHCFNPHAEIFHKIGDSIYQYDLHNGYLRKQDLAMTVGTSGLFRDSDDLGDSGSGPILAEVKSLDGVSIVRTYWRKAMSGISLGVIAIPEDGIYATVTPEVVLRLAPDPAMLFSDINLIQRYNEVFNARWYEEEKQGTASVG